MTDSDHQTSIFMNNNYVGSPDGSNGRRLLSSSGENKSKTRMTRPSKLSIRAILIVLLIITIVIAVIIIVTLTAISPRAHELTPTIDNSGDSTSLPSNHVRCAQDVNVTTSSDEHWLSFHIRSPEWTSFPQVSGTDYVLISRKYELRAGLPGVQLSVQFPNNNTMFHVMAVTSHTRHSHPKVMSSASGVCQITVIDDPKFFDGNETHFRIYIFNKGHVPLKGAKFAITSLPRDVIFRDMHYKSATTTNPQFSHVELRRRDRCSVEIVERSKVNCEWWNLENGDSANFEKMDRHDCISSGVSSSVSATWFFSMTAHEKNLQSRALLVSPIIERNTSSILFTLWYMFKCEGPRIRIHLVPANQPLHRMIGVSHPVAEVTEPASHSAWKFLSFEIPLPATHDAYHLIMEGIVLSRGNCSGHYCYNEGVAGRKESTSPMLGVDDITIELLHNKCIRAANKTSVMDCKFQDGNKSTTCEWESSYKDHPFWGKDYDWEAVSSGNGDDHGAAVHHFIDRGHIMSFDASTKSGPETFVRSPFLRANNNCACAMTFIYLLRGVFAPRFQVNLIYDITSDRKQSEPQWSLSGHQSEIWQKATIPINLRKDIPFIIELRVSDIQNTFADVHFDDMMFIGCDMEKYEE